MLKKLFFDGASRGNPGLSAWAWILLKENGEVLHKDAGVMKGDHTNNEAEYTALLEGLRFIDENKIEDVVVAGDSLLVVNQVLGKYKCKAENLKNFHREARTLIGKRAIKHVPRNSNKLADAACNNVLDAYVRQV